MTKFRVFCSIFICNMAVFISSLSSSSPKKYYPDSINGDEYHQRPQTSHSTRYHESNLPVAASTKPSAANELPAPPFINSNERFRFGSVSPQYSPLTSGTSGGGGGGGYNTYSSSPYGSSVAYQVAPMRIDLGGLALGALIGLGAVLFLPKIGHVLGGGGGPPSGGYHSFLGADDDGLVSLGETLSKLDNSLEQHQIDSSSCVQRIVCNMVHATQKSIESLEASKIDQILFAVMSNPLIKYMMDGTAIKQAIEMGQGHDIGTCEKLIEKCPISKEKITAVLSTLINSQI